MSGFNYKRLQERSTKKLEEQRNSMKHAEIFDDFMYCVPQTRGHIVEDEIISSLMDIYQDSIEVFQNLNNSEGYDIIFTNPTNNRLIKVEVKWSTRRTKSGQGSWKQIRPDDKRFDAYICVTFNEEENKFEWYLINKEEMSQLRLSTQHSNADDKIKVMSFTKRNLKKLNDMGCRCSFEDMANRIKDMIV